MNDEPFLGLIQNASLLLGWQSLSSLIWRRAAQIETFPHKSQCSTNINEFDRLSMLLFPRSL